MSVFMIIASSLVKKYAKTLFVDFSCPYFWRFWVPDLYFRFLSHFFLVMLIAVKVTLQLAVIYQLALS